MTAVHALKRGVVVLELTDASDRSKRSSEIYQATIENVTFVKLRKLEADEAVVLALSFWRRRQWPVIR